MLALMVFGVAGFLAQLVSGMLGMGYGMTSTTALVAFGTAPAVASASAHFAQVGTSLASGVSHWKFRNIDWRTVGILAVPGAIGAAVGAFVLVSLSTDFASAWISTILFALGLYVLIRFAFLKLGKLITDKRPGAKFLAPLGLIAGFIDSTGGGGWGPVATTTLLSSGRLEPRKVVGSVGAAEFAVTVSACAAFLIALSHEEMNWVVVGGLLVGGVIAAPLGAWLARHLPPRVLGTAAGGLIILTNGWLLLSTLGASPAAIVVVYLGLVALIVAALVNAVRSMREEKRINALAGEDDIRETANR
ncbi:permease [Prauserella sp. PE36]|uniref:Probable membrane transporter protein n=1 Tax=Prauserella endophytica TaxID=1592324 RepID=A0ABY2SCP8_9PSEU|nr:MULTISPECIES: sulfite exporter TauE/SafE family protein [Prauserella]PXY34570.1 permease [Prauserella coralliicola]RBM12972.1 permease [Prauserella sp. PE36]TKG73109.1 sulfite exporter TauE/SafE family protein [Prauserella endophytica]